MGRIRELENEIKRHDLLYWREQSPEISDPEYDKMVEELRAIDPDNALFQEMPETAGTIKHEQAMLSLQKAYTMDEVLKWARSVARNEQEIFRVSPKFDGVACEISPNLIVTRGDGYVGEDITRHAPLIDFELQTQEVERGELVVLKPDLLGLHRSDGSKYKTCRNAAAGLLNLKEPPEFHEPPIMFMPHSSEIGICTLAELPEIDLELTMLEEQDRDWPIDGLVISLADREYGESLGYTSHHPKHSVAFKIKNPQTTSVLLEVVWQVSKTRIAPVAILSPVELDGVTITKATLHNLQQIKRLNIGIGSEVVIERAGSVIPAITAAITEGKPITPPKDCPACGAPTDNDGQDVWCTSAECGGTKAKLLQSSLSRLGIDECGPAVCASLVELGHDTVSKVLRMTIDDWNKVAGYAERSAAKMFHHIANRKLIPIEDFKVLASLNIEGVGETVSRKICDKMSLSITREGLDKVEGVGAVLVERLLEIDPVELMDLTMALNVKNTMGSASQKTICFTGKSHLTRDQWIGIAEEKGYRFAKSVTKTLDILVTDSMDSASTKTQKAQKYGVQIMTYDDFEALP